MKGFRISGELVLSFQLHQQNLWLIGEDIERRTGHVSLRSMSDPNAEGQPDTYKGITGMQELQIQVEYIPIVEY
jgi:Zn-dependent metalloprotease